MAVVVVKDLVKRYGDNEAVAGVSFHIDQGEVFALLGPNGAGKTTTVEVLEGHRRRSAGEVEVLGFDPATGGSPFRERIGIVLQSGGVDQELTVTEIVTMYAGFYPAPRRPAEVIALAGLEDKAGARAKTLSGGQLRRLDLAIGLVGDPQLIFLDEPTTGFDPAARRQAWSVLDDLRSLGKTILLTTHYMDEAQHLADRVAVIAAGRIVEEGRPETLGGRLRRRARVSFRLANPPPQPPPGLGAEVAMWGEAVELEAADPTPLLHALTGWALAEGRELEGLTVSRPSLEDVYLALVGGSGEGA